MNPVAHPDLIPQSHSHENEDLKKQEHPLGKILFGSSDRLWCAGCEHFVLAAAKCLCPRQGLRVVQQFCERLHTCAMVLP